MRQKSNEGLNDTDTAKLTDISSTGKVNEQNYKKNRLNYLPSRHSTSACAHISPTTCLPDSSQL
jgi:hypothetical protein